MRIKVFSFDEQISGGDFDLAVNGFLPKPVRYKRELSGESNVLKELAELSKNVGAAIVCPFDTDNYGIMKKSAGVFEGGKLLGISDMNVAYADSPYMPSASGKIYSVGGDKFALAIEDDMYSYEILKAYAICGADAVIFLKKNHGEMDGTVIRAFCYSLGLSAMFISPKTHFAFNSKGQNVEPDGDGVYDLISVAEYNLEIRKTKFTK
ncbi:MAG: hypothetical protein IJ706_05700 [Clostridia bacterium]|nr:hypothetical protein [Clostridia bacterium]